MPRVPVNGIRLHYEEVGQGAPLVFVHEFAGEGQSWHLQVRFFARRYRTITFNARGYPPSDVPTAQSAYSQDQAVEDIRGLLDALGIDAGPRLRAVHGRLRDAPLRPPPSGPGAVAGRGGLRLRERGGRSRAVQARRRGHRPAVPDRAHGDDGRRLLPGAHASPVPGQGPEGLAGVPRPCSPRSRPSATASRCAASSSRGPRSTSSSGELERLTVPTLIVTGDEDEPCLEPGDLPEAEDPHLGAGRDPEGRAHDQPRGAGGVQPRRPRLPDRGRVRRAGALRNPASQTGSAILPSNQADRR